NPDEAVPSFVSGAMAKAGKGLLEGTLQAGTSAVSDKLLDLVGLGGKSAADKGKDTRDYLRSEERRVGKECRFGWARYCVEKKQQKNGIHERLRRGELNGHASDDRV